MAQASPKVMIVGAGLGGLVLGILLEKMGIEYDIFERSAVCKPYGAGMSVGANIMPLLEQLGILSELKKVSLPATTMDIYSEDMSLIGSMLGTEHEAEVGYGNILFSRPEFHSLLLSKIPTNRIHYNKKVTSVEQTEAHALIRCADGQTHEGDILIGADGAYSTVRTSIYNDLKKENKLPANDIQEMNVGYACVVGTTTALSTEKYPCLKGETSKFAVCIADGKPHSWTLISVPGERIAWGFVIQLSPEEKKAAVANAEWKPESIDTTISKIVHHKVPYGGTIGDLVDATPKDLISKVYLEDKLFETWNHGRIALLGDACHKMLPSAGQGATNAMEDAVIIANCIYELGSSFSKTHIEAALTDYRSQRFEHAKQQVENSNMAGKLFYGQTWLERLIRRAVLNWIPKSFEKASLTQAVAYRPQATFLPMVPKRGTFPILPQKMSKRYEEEQAKKNVQAV
ncbi:FAD/NAD(P)-binding domain-containing protein [Linnemannia elongata AG-77]|uniref:FAD/NAD(P)-binding domain-containing protein n=1 Tax=Linnemannia elongata AG-77 TaxID=1314771 RepID=A0A197KC62_9FUNG|nr:FAD/NAD(P)-binding domain-containing protein [Linnemannia elongata AG-77]